MKENVVITVFEVESEAFQAFAELRAATAGKGYDVFEAGLIKRHGNGVDLLDGFSYAPADSDTATGIIVGSLVGILGGPIGVILGAGIGALVGNSSDTERALDDTSLVAVLASKIYEGEVAIAALVNEDEPAFDAVFANFKTTIIRYDASDIADDVDRLYELQSEISNQVVAQIKAENKADREERRSERRDEIQAKMDERAKVEAETNKIVRDLRPI
jgi:uncharacterized membrane protein